MKTTIQTLLLTLAIFSLAGCTGLEYLSNKMRMMVGKSIVFVEPPKATELATINSLIVSPSNTSSAKISNEVRRNLVSTKIGNQSYFKRVVTDERDEVRSSDLNWANIAISSDQPNIHESSSSEDRFRCPGKGTIRTCSSDEAQHYSVSCQTRFANASATITAKDSATSNILFTRTISGEKKSKICSDTGGNMASSESLKQALTIMLARDLIQDVIPTVVERPLDLIDDEGSLSEQEKSLLSITYNMAGEGQIEKALENYTKMLASHPSNATLLFNAGYCEQALGNFEKANTLYTQASKNSPTLSILAKYHNETKSWLAKGVSKVRL
ncbi:MAG: tetratricopeptide repeat protein [Pseudomonadales bacterium]|nr:tetratricopeptide repeat protein [Pseudomonadales bacterium]